MAGSILTDIKKLLGIPEDYEVFDQDVIIHINSAFSVLHQVGAAAPEQFFKISDKNKTWAEYIDGVENVEMLKTYVYLKVRLVFDPPTTSFAITAFQEQAKELEVRLNYLELKFNPNAYDHLQEGTVDA